MHQNKYQNKNKQHEPVLLLEVLHYLDPKKGETYLDLTAGYGGHARAILERTGSLTPATLVDRDNNAIKQLEEAFSSSEANLVNQDFLTASQALLAEGRQFDLILVDLGVSSPHLNSGERGFAINTTGPLDMRMDQSQELTASRVINSYSEAALTDLLAKYGEEPKARQIAKLIVDNRPFETTTQLATVVAKAWPGYSRVHPATRTFQAIRIAVNDELRQLEQGLPIWFKLLAPGGRLAVISFHSLEDRLVKRAMLEQARAGFEAELELLTKRPISASPEEIVFNPRARSAKLRAVAKIKKKGNA